MKRIFIYPLLLFIFISCTKDETINNEVLTSPVDLFEGQYNEDSRVINLTWRYGTSTDIDRFELFYSPGQDSVENLSPWERSYSLYGIISDTTYLFNIRAVDLNENYSEARVVYISTSSEK